MWIEREIKKILKDSQEIISIVMGPRQCGKSSALIHYLGPEWLEISFDDLALRAQAQDDPAMFLSRYQDRKLIIDEAQYAPHLFPQLKRLIDLKKRAKRLGGAPMKGMPKQICLSGSNRVFLEKHVQESLAGRARYLEMSTLSVSEILAWNPDIDLFDFQFKGGWPEIYAENLSPVDYLNDYIRSAIERDIIFANGIQKADEFLRFLRLLANRTGEILSLESLSRDAGVVSNSLREWLSLLTRMGVVGVLPTYSSHLNKRLTKQGKVYFMDCGLAARLQGYTSLESLKSNPRLGSLFETLVYAEIMKAKMNHRLDLTPYLWRTKDQEEIDFFIETPRQIILIEAKMAMQNIQPIKISESVKKVIGGRDWTAVTVTFGSGASVGLLPNNQQIPIGKLQSFLRASI